MVAAGAEDEGATVTIEVDGATEVVGGASVVETEIMGEDTAELEDAAELEADAEEAEGTTAVEVAPDPDALAEGVADAPPLD